MKKYTLDEFIETLMSFEEKYSGCAEWDDFEKCMCFYVHLDDEGNLLHSIQGEETGFAVRWLLSPEEAEIYYNGKLEDQEREFIREEVYPEYLNALEEL